MRNIYFRVAWHILRYGKETIRVSVPAEYTNPNSLPLSQGEGRGGVNQ